MFQVDVGLSVAPTPQKVVLLLGAICFGCSGAALFSCLCPMSLVFLENKIEVHSRSEHNTGYSECR